MEYSHEKQKKKNEIRQCRNYLSDVKTRDILRCNIKNYRFTKYAKRMHDENKRIKYLSFVSPCI